MTGMEIIDVISGIVTAVKANSMIRHGALEDADYKVSDKYMIYCQEDSPMFKDYSPNVFRYIRTKILKYDDNEYLNSWQVPKIRVNFKESEGRSGSMFYQTNDKKYFLKTILHNEARIMRKLLKDYVDMLDKHGADGVFIMKIIGLYRVSYSLEKSWILVFCNSLPVSSNVYVDEILDLKGRVPKKGKSFRERGRLTKEGAAKKDNELDRGLSFESDEYREKYAAIVSRDASFLSSHNLMDYSLLVGIVRFSNQNKPSPDENKTTDGDQQPSLLKTKKTSTMACMTSVSDSAHVTNQYDLSFLLSLGGYLGVNRKTNMREVYFFGIIDCLTEYAINKKLANAFKRVLWTNKSLSTVKSSFYAKRFTKFMTSTLLNKDIFYDKASYNSIEKNKK